MYVCACVCVRVITAIINLILHCTLLTLANAYSGNRYMYIVH